MVTRIELVDHIDAAFAHGSATRDTLLAAATASGARPEVIDTLQRLSDKLYTGARELWYDLPDIPVQH